MIIIIYKIIRYKYKIKILKITFNLLSFYIINICKNYNYFINK